MSIKIGPDAGDIKDALRQRHPAYDPNFAGVGRWTCLEEWCGIDLLALDAWQAAAVIGYEVKISRSDLRSELLKPSKRAQAVAMCTRFYIAVPAGLLTREEKAFQEPLDWTPEDFERQRCQGIPEFGPSKWGGKRSTLRYGGRCEGKAAKGSSFGRKRVKPFTVDVAVPYTVPVDTFVVPSYITDDNRQDHLERMTRAYHEKHRSVKVDCPTCGATGYTSKSRVELEAPTLWIPNDVGLIEVDGRGCTVAREAPGNKAPASILGRLPHEVDQTVNRLQRQDVAQLVRWTSVRPDSRHCSRK